MICIKEATLVALTRGNEGVLSHVICGSGLQERARGASHDEVREKEHGPLQPIRLAIANDVRDDER
eukprot:scaffold17768_cov31-Tisochrysis_lutea.AAC.10